MERSRRANSSSLGPSFLDRSDTPGKIWVVSLPEKNIRPIRSRHFLALRFLFGSKRFLVDEWCVFVYSKETLYNFTVSRIINSDPNMGVEKKRNSTEENILIESAYPGDATLARAKATAVRVSACPSARSSRPRQPPRAPPQVYRSELRLRPGFASPCSRAASARSPPTPRESVTTAGMCPQRAASAAAGGPRMYVVRHEKRPVEDPSFFVSLTEEGLSDSADAVRAKLLAANITKVYASPFRRVLQTVHPFLSESGLKANVDWALYEHPEPNPEPITALPDDFHALFPIEKTYEPSVPGPAIAARNRDFDDVHTRIREFVRKLSETHGEGDILLLATHQTSVHSLLHQQSGIPMDCLNVPMGTVLELDWRAIVARGE